MTMAQTTSAIERTLLKAASQCGLDELREVTTRDLDALPSDHGQPVAAVRGLLVIGEATAELVVAAKLGWPNTLPLVFLQPWDAFGIIPHVETDGFVCFAHEAGLIIDHNRLATVALEVVRSAIQVLTDGVRGRNVQDFVDEFQPYWNRQKVIGSLTCLVEPTPEPKVVRLLLEGNNYKFVCDHEDSVRDYLSGAQPKVFTQKKAIYVPLPLGSVVVPPHPEEPWTVAYFLDTIYSQVKGSDRKQIAKLCAGIKQHNEFLVLFLPKADGTGGTLFGLEFRGDKGNHTLAGGQETKTAKPYKLIRKDRSFLLPRGGASGELHEKHVALVGCGSIGGFLAFELARAGIGTLTLVDPDMLVEENIFRHVLGRKHTGDQKVHALKKRLEEEIPYVCVSTLESRIEEAIDQGHFDPSSFDAIVCSVGSPSIDLYLNRMAYGSSSTFPPMLYTWVEAYGIGGHVIVTNNTRASGCLECLYTAMPDDQDGYHCRASFAKPAQEFGRNISGCSGLFIPYGSTTAVKAAAMAAEATVKVLSGETEGNPLRSFRGPSADFLANGYELANRYSLQSAGDPLREHFDYANPDCPVCGDNR